MRYSSAALARKIPSLLLRNAFRGIPRFTRTKNCDRRNDKKYILLHEPRFVSLFANAIAEHKNDGGVKISILRVK